MNFSNTSITSADRRRAKRLEIARKLYRALAAQDPGRVIILCDGSGKVLGRHDLGLEQSDLAES